VTRERDELTGVPFCDDHSMFPIKIIAGRRHKDATLMKSAVVILW
jgi:hypothetical protein